jgi:hypothetical protein
MKKFQFKNLVCHSRPNILRISLPWGGYPGEEPLRNFDYFCHLGQI